MLSRDEHLLDYIKPVFVLGTFIQVGMGRPEVTIPM